MIKEVNDNSFNSEVLTNDKPVVVDFWAPWCGPCKMVGPVLEELEKGYGDKISFVKVNVDENNMLSQKYNVSSIPTIMIFSKGSNVESMVGFRPKQALEDVMKKYI